MKNVLLGKDSAKKAVIGFLEATRIIGLQGEAIACLVKVGCPETGPARHLPFAPHLAARGNIWRNP